MHLIGRERITWKSWNSTGNSSKLAHAVMEVSCCFFGFFDVMYNELPIYWLERSGKGVFCASSTPNICGSHGFFPRSQSISIISYLILIPCIRKWSSIMGGGGAVGAWGTLNIALFLEPEFHIEFCKTPPPPSLLKYTYIKIFMVIYIACTHVYYNSPFLLYGFNKLYTIQMCKAAPWHRFWGLRPSPFRLNYLGAPLFSHPQSPPIINDRSLNVPFPSEPGNNTITACC